MTTKPFEEFMSEINSVNIEEALSNAEKCLESFEARDIIKQQQETINRQQAEIERLSDRNHKCIYLSDEESIEYCVDGPCPNFKIESQIKAEAVKEFAERLKGFLDDFYHAEEDALLETSDLIDNLVKEMVGEG